MVLLASHGLRFGYDILRRLLDLHQPTRIKTAHAACSIRPDVPRQRRACLEDKIILGSDRLVFVDERWASITSAANRTVEMRAAWQDRACPHRPLYPTDTRGTRIAARS